MRRLTWREVWRRRLARHFLTQPADSLSEAAKAMCGVHAQVQASAELELGLRTLNASKSDVTKALWQEKSLVRTYGLRGTVHLYAADDVHLWLTAFTAKASPRSQNKYEERSIGARVDEVVQAIHDALDGQCLNREQLSQALEERLGSWVTAKTFPGFNTVLPPWYLALAPAAHAGVLAFGPSWGTQVTYVRLDQWLEQAQQIDPQGALREVLRRFLHAYGPAQPDDFAKWLLTTPNFARAMFHELTDEIEQVDVEGWQAWQLRDDVDAQASEGSVHLLPYFDVYIVGGYPRSQLIPSAAPEAIRKVGTAAPFATLLVDGVIGGLWTRKRVGKRFVVQVDSFVALTDEQEHAVADYALRVGEVLEAPIDFSFDHVEPKGHW